MKKIQDRITYGNSGARSKLTASKILLARSYAAENTKRSFTETQHDRITGGESQMFPMNDVNLLNFGTSNTRLLIKLPAKNTQFL
jgi:hypothetical protein